MDFLSSVSTEALLALASKEKDYIIVANCNRFSSPSLKVERIWISLVASKRFIGMQLQDGRAEFFASGGRVEGDEIYCLFQEEGYCEEQLKSFTFNETYLHNSCEWNIPSDSVDQVVCDAYTSAEEQVRREGRLAPISSQTLIDHLVVPHPRVERYGEFVNGEEIIAVLKDLRTIVVFVSEDYQLRFHLPPGSPGTIKKVLVISNGFAVLVADSRSTDDGDKDEWQIDGDGGFVDDQSTLSLVVFEYGKFWKTVATDIQGAFGTGGAVVYY